MEFLSDLSNVSALEIALWVLQTLFLGLYLRPALRPTTVWEPSWTFCGLALALAFGWRMAVTSVLFGTGYAFYWGDDPIRWAMAYDWTVAPYIMTWDGIWVGGGFYTVGWAIDCFGDPLLALRIIAVIHQILLIVGLFVFALGLTRRRIVACAAVLLAAPLWHHILLGSGAMTEVPRTGWMMLGAGMLLIGLRRPSGASRSCLMTAAGLSFVCATALHYSAWMFLTVILLALLAYAVREPGRQAGFGPVKWLAFSALSTSFCLVWAIASWVRFGAPWGFLQNQAGAMLGEWGHVDVVTRLLIYPAGLLLLLRPLAPLALAAVVAPWFGPANPEVRRVRVATLILGAVMLVLCLSTFRGGFPSVALRAMVGMSTAILVLVAWFAFRCAAVGTAAPQSHRRWALGRLGSNGLLVVCALLWFVVQTTEVLGNRYRWSRPISDARAVGAWLYGEMHQPKHLPVSARSLPIRLWLPDASRSNEYGLILSGAGDLHRLQRFYAVDRPHLETMRPGQALVAQRPIVDPRVVKITTIGDYLVYVFEPDGTAQQAARAGVGAAD